MKKILVLLTVLVSVFSFSAGVFAQVAALPTTYTCSTTIGKVDCTLGQGRSLCSPFDFQTGAGYCPLTKQTYSNKAIFLICNCPDTATNFRQGSKIGIRMTILVNDLAGQRGAYWAAATVGGIANINFGMYPDTTTACAGTAFNSFGPGHFYKTTNVTPTGYVTPYTGEGCPVGSANQATVYVTDRTAGYTITAADETNALNRWYVEIPPIRIDPNILHNGEVIKVRVEFLNQDIGRGICADCPPICEGTITVAIVCCSDSSTCTFPYFTSTTAANDVQPYWNGIAIVNNSGTRGTATLSVFQQDGVTGTFTTDPIEAGSMFVQPLEAIPFVASGGTLGDQPVYITVTTTFGSMEGFAMMADTSTGESMGYLCRKPCDSYTGLLRAGN